MTLPASALQLLSDPDRLEAAINAEEARRSGSRSFAAFVKQAWHLIPDSGALQWSPYLEGLCAVLEAAAAGRLKRLLVNGPPRNGKSNVLAILWPAWVWIDRPTETFLYLSYKSDLAREHQSRCADVVSSKWYQDTYKPKWKLVTNTQEELENSVGGRRLAATMDGKGVTGRGANKIVFDDPLSAEDAGSEAARKNATRIVEQVMLTRFNDRARGVGVITMQRVHYHDPSKWAIDRGWAHMVCPLVKDERQCRILDDEGKELWRDARAEGEVLVPTRFPPRDVEEIKSNLVLFTTQYQQAPLEHVSAGMYFQRAWFRIVVAGPAGDQVVRRVRRWDLASTENGGDWTVGVKLALLDDKRLVVEDVVRGQWGPHDVRQTVRATAELDGYDVEVSIPQDPGQAGKDQAAQYASILFGYSFHTRPETGDKEVRAGAASAQARAGNMSLVAAPWNEPFLQVLEAFPDPSVHDDDVDALAGAVNHLAQARSTIEMWEDIDL